jgi:hypothetical protein
VLLIKIVIGAAPLRHYQQYGGPCAICLSTTCMPMCVCGGRIVVVTASITLAPPQRGNFLLQIQREATGDERVGVEMFS